MNESILDSVKKALGIQPDYTHFDTDLIMHINSVLSILSQLMIGPESGLSIEDNSATWSELISDNKKLNMVKTYVTQKVKMIFDPPQSSAVMESMKNQIAEFEFRMNLEVDRGKDYAWKGIDDENSISE